MRRTSITTLMAAVLALGAAPALGDEVERLSLARKLLAQVHEDDSLRASLPLLAAEMRRALAQQGQKDEQADAFVARFQQRMGAEIGRYGDMVAEAYAQSFSEEDLAAVIAFNATPLGQRFIAKRPELTQASVLTMQKLSREVAQEVAEGMQADKAQGRVPGKL